MIPQLVSVVLLHLAMETSDLEQVMLAQLLAHLTVILMELVALVPPVLAVLLHQMPTVMVLQVLHLVKELINYNALMEESLELLPLVSVMTVMLLEPHLVSVINSALLVKIAILMVTAKTAVPPLLTAQLII